MARRKRSRREVETMEFKGAVRRFVKAYGSRVAEGDPVDLAEMFAVRAEFDRAIEEAVLGQRKTFSWGQIAEGVGMPKQNLHRKYAHLEGGADQAPVSSSVA